jgi:hypothetical protein
MFNWFCFIFNAFHDIITDFKRLKSLKIDFNFTQSFAQGAAIAIKNRQELSKAYVFYLFTFLVIFDKSEIFYFFNLKYGLFKDGIIKRRTATNKGNNLFGPVNEFI